MALDRSINYETIKRFLVCDDFEGESDAVTFLRSVRVTLRLRPEQVPRDILPPEGAPGSAKAKVSWDIRLTGEPPLVLRASLSVKNFRKLLKQLEKHDKAELSVALHGRLVGNGVLEEASVQVDVKKGSLQGE